MSAESDDWGRLIKAQAGDVEASATRVRNLSNNVIVNEYPSAAAVVGREVDHFVGMIAIMRMVKIDDVGEDVARKASEGIVEVFKLQTAALGKGDYRTVRNVLTSIYNVADVEKKILSKKLLDDLGAVPKKIASSAERDARALGKDFDGWLKKLGNKLYQADPNWLGAVGEIKVGRIIFDIPGVKLLKWNPLDARGKLGADLIVDINGKNVSVEIKNWDFSVADAARVRKSASRFAEQLIRHLPDIRGGGEGRQAIIIIIGNDIAQNDIKTSATSMRHEVVRKAHALSPDLTKNLTVDNVIMLKQRGSGFSGETIKEVLRMAPDSTVGGSSQSVGVLI